MRRRAYKEKTDIRIGWLVSICKAQQSPHGTIVDSEGAGADPFETLIAESCECRIRGTQGSLAIAGLGHETRPAMSRIVRIQVLVARGHSVRCSLPSPVVDRTLMSRPADRMPGPRGHWVLTPNGAKA